MITPNGSASAEPQTISVGELSFTRSESPIDRILRAMDGGVQYGPRQTRALVIFDKVAARDRSTQEERQFLSELVSAVGAGHLLYTDRHSLVVEGPFNRLQDRFNIHCAPMAQRIADFMGRDLLSLSLEEARINGYPAMVRVSAWLILAYDLSRRYPEKVIPARAYETTNGQIASP